MTLKGTRRSLDTPDLPVQTLPIRVQLVNGDGPMLGGDYATTLRNQDDRLKAKSD